MSLQSVATAEAYAAALNQLTGTPALVVHKPDYSAVSFQNPELTAQWIEKQLRPTTPGEVRLDLMPAVLPVVLKRAIPAAVALVAVGYLLGRIK